MLVVDDEDVENFIFYGVYYGMGIVCVVEWERCVFVKYYVLCIKFLFLFCIM